MSFKDIITIVSSVLITAMFFLGAVMIYLAGPFFVVLLVLKIINFQGIYWFGWPLTVSVFGTPFWLGLFGLIFIGTAPLLLDIIHDFIHKPRRRK